MTSSVPEEAEDDPPLLYFVYLTSDSRYSYQKNLQEVIPYIGLHQNPVEDLRRQNREPGYRGADHTTKRGAGFLQLELVIGPSPLQHATTFQQEWRRSSRKLISRIQKGVALATRDRALMKGVGSCIYCSNPQWVRQQLAAQQQHTPTRG